MKTKGLYLQGRFYDRLDPHLLPAPIGIGDREKAKG